MEFLIVGNSVSCRIANANTQVGQFSQIKQGVVAIMSQPPKWRLCVSNALS